MIDRELRLFITVALKFELHGFNIAEEKVKEVRNNICTRNDIYILTGLTCKFE